MTYEHLLSEIRGAIYLDGSVAGPDAEAEAIKAAEDALHNLIEQLEAFQRVAEESRSHPHGAGMFRWSNEYGRDVCAARTVDAPCAVCDALEAAGFPVPEPRVAVDWGSAENSSAPESYPASGPHRTRDTDGWPLEEHGA